MIAQTARKIASDYLRQRRAERVQMILRYIARRVIAGGLVVLAYLLVIR